VRIDLARQSLLVFIVLLCAGMHAGPLRAQAPQAGREMVEVARDVYLMTGSGSNSIYVVTEDGVLVFDSDIRNADQDRAAIRRVTDKRVVYLFSSHASGDHSSGGWHFREDNPVYITPRDQVRAYFMTELKEFEERKAEGRPGFSPESQLIQPTIGFDDSLTLYFGGLTFQARAEGYGHTSGDTTLYIPQRRIMFMGDLLNNEVHPGQADAGGVFKAQIQGQIEILNRIIERSLAVDTYVPGHGPVHIGRGVADVSDQRDYFVLMREEVANMVLAGKSREQILKEFRVPERFSRYPPGRLPNILRLFYNQLIENGY
jgi:cyclase